jgi:rod shape-determining protein MreD
MPMITPKRVTISTRQHGWLIAGSLLTALACNLLPWRVDLLWLRPDFLLLVTLYWAIYQPNDIGIGSAWWLGLLEDIIDGAHLGQHALAYAVAVYAITLFQRRLYNFPPWQQILPVMAILLIEQLMTVVIATFIGDSRQVALYFFAVVTGTLCWMPIWYLLRSRHGPMLSHQQ